MVKSRLASYVALMVSAALIPPTALVTAGPGQTPARGYPIRDCPTELATAARLERGLQSFTTKIDQYQRQLDDARNAEGHLTREAQKQADQARRDLTVGTTVSVLNENILGVRRAIEKLAISTARANALPLLTAFKQLKNIEELSQKMDRLLAAGNWKLAMQEGQTFTEQISAFADYLNESGLAGELGSAAGVSARLAGTGAGGAALSGLVGGLAVAAGIYAITTVAADEAAFLNALDRRAAADTVNQLRERRSTYQERITSVRSICSQPAQRAEQSGNPPSSPLPIPPPEAAGGGPGAGTALLLGGLGAAGIVGYQQYKQNQGCIKEAQAILDVQSACIANVFSATCQSAFDAGDACCRKIGKSSYDRSIGDCR